MALAHALVTAPSVVPRGWMLFLHGILGSGGNWRTIARQFTAGRPSWGAVLVDLRMHGASQDFAPPHTVATAAQDLLALEAGLPGPVRGVLGHSFGAKVAMMYADRRGESLTAAWYLDGMPGARLDARGSEITYRVVSLLESWPRAYPTRQAFVDRVRAAGFDDAIAQWLAMNVRREGDRFVWRLDVVAIRTMLEDYFARDLWHVLERPRGKVNSHVLVAGRSNVFDADDRTRLEQVRAANPSRTTVGVFESAGHWLHVDAPDDVLAALVGRTADP